jgi:cytochrome c oxidase subunit I
MFKSILPQDMFGKHIFKLWFLLAISALAFSGIYSFFPYALRTPFLAKILNLADLFSVSLMVHVNLGVLVWFMSVASMLMTILIKPSFYTISFTAVITAIVGTVFIIVSPFVGSAEAYKNDYIPILHNFCFILGIALFFSACLVQSIIAALSFSNVQDNIAKLIIFYLAVIFLVSVVVFLISVFQLKQVVMQTNIGLLQFYQLLFWGMGHVLQFCYVQLLIFAWIVIIDRANIQLNLEYDWFRLVMRLNFAGIVILPLLYLVYPVDDMDNYNFFTLHMKYWGGALTMLIAGIIAYSIFKSKASAHIGKTAFYYSLMLITTGGVIGYLIKGANVTIPAHYHGVILGITVSLMGLFYVLVTEINGNAVRLKKANWQISLYSFGQLIHVVALAISGGYGVLRKDAGTALSLNAKFFMGAMGIGGTIALIGGVLFVILILQQFKKQC